MLQDAKGTCEQPSLCRGETQTKQLHRETFRRTITQVALCTWRPHAFLDPTNVGPTTTCSDFLWRTSGVYVEDFRREES